MFDNECPICLEIISKTHSNHKSGYSKVIEDKSHIIWSNRFFTLIPSLGPLNLSHLLIVPNQHILSLSELDLNGRNSLEQIKKALRKFNNKLFGEQTEFFEHGTGCEVNHGGACIAHAHLHSISTNESVLGQLENKVKLQPVDEETFYTSNFNIKGYLYIEDQNGKQWLNNDDIFPSQFLRQCYSSIFGNLNKWDWRQSYKVSDIKRIINNYKNFGDFIVENNNN